MASWACADVGGLLLLERREALPWSRIFWIWAERFGFVGRGGGGVWLGRARRDRWRGWRAVRVGLRVGLEVGSVMSLLVGSMWRG